MIEIKCEGADLVSLDELSNFQGNLKSIKEQNLIKLKNSIIKQGFIAPIFVWKNKKSNWILDGHQRLKALRSLEEDGEEIPPLPIAYVQADNIKEAKEKLLHITSQHGDFSIDGLDLFLMDAELDAESLSEVRLLDTELIYPPDGMFAVQEDGSSIEEKYEEPDKKELTCPSCGHVDSAERFKKV